jgi:hypothetical protein
MANSSSSHSESRKSEFKYIPGVGTAYYHVQAQASGADSPKTVTFGKIEEHTTQNGTRVSISCSASAQSTEE